MISVQEAKDLIKENISPLETRELSLEHAQGLVLGSDLFSTINIPAYPQSSMDGYAFKWIEGRTEYHIMGEMAAGSNQQLHLKEGEASRIFTGAAVPTEADTVVMQEKTSRINDQLILSIVPEISGENVRPVGSEIKKGALAIQSGSTLTPASIGFLAGMGINKIQAHPKPRVTIIVTGNELQRPGEPLGYGQVFESNSFTLIAALQQLQIEVSAVHRSADDLPQLSAFLSSALQESDLVLMTGGVSVGDYDFTLAAFNNCGVRPIFHKVKQKPGKPVLFGLQGAKPVFGLPGNPASVLTCFYQYVLPAIGRLMNKELQLQSLFVPLTSGFSKTPALTQFLKASLQKGEAHLLLGQESYKLNTFSTANCFVVIPEEKKSVEKGDLIEIQLLPI